MKLSEVKLNSQYELEAYVNPDIRKWHPLCRAQYLEMKLFMAGYLLSSQGDRMMMGNSVEGRFPYLDHRVIEFASQIPPFYKIRGGKNNPIDHQ
ncbi:MAG: asparagine synthase-related protein [Candidatus Helarchaeota archaeon]